MLVRAVVRRHNFQPIKTGSGDRFEPCRRSHSSHNSNLCFQGFGFFLCPYPNARNNDKPSFQGFLNSSVTTSASRYAPLRLKFRCTDWQPRGGGYTIPVVANNSADFHD